MIIQLISSLERLLRFHASIAAATNFCATYSALLFLSNNYPQSWMTSKLLMYSQTPSVAITINLSFVES